MRNRPTRELNDEELRGYLQELDARLQSAYGKPVINSRPALEELILTVLSQNTNDRNRDTAYTALRANYPTWESVAAAPLEELVDVLRPAGLAPQKAPRIKAIVSRVLEGGFELEALASLGPEQAARKLMSLPGVGVKTAFCTLSFSFGMPVFPMDTHILRVFARLGVIPEQHNVEREHFRITGLVEKGRHGEFHLNVITHGRRTCKARGPLCGQCTVSDVCDRFQSGNAEKNR